MRPIQGYGEMLQNWNRFWDEYHSLQTSLNRRLRDRLQFGVHYTLSLSQEDNRDVPVRLVHTPDGNFSIHEDCSCDFSSDRRG